MTAAGSPNSSCSMQFLGSTSTTRDPEAVDMPAHSPEVVDMPARRLEVVDMPAHNPEVVDMPAHSPDMVDMPSDDMMDVGGPWTAPTAPVAAAAAFLGGSETAAAAPEKEPYYHATGGALGTQQMDYDASAFEVDMSGGSYEDLIASGVNDFFDVFRALDDEPDEGGFPEGGMEVDDAEFAWLNSPDAFMPLPVADPPTAEGGDLGQAAAATVVPTGEEEDKEEETGMGTGLGDENMEEDVAEGLVVTGFAIPEATPEVAPAAAAAMAATTIWPPAAVAATTIWPPAAAAVAATPEAPAVAVATTTMLPPVALEGGTTEGTGITGGEYAVSPALAYDFGRVGGGVAGYMFAGVPSEGIAVFGAVDVGVATAEAIVVTPTATNMNMVNGAAGGGGSGGGGSGGGGGEHVGGLSQKELIRRQKVERYLAKKQHRRWSRASSYESRQRVANNRPRHKGRFLPLVSNFVPISELKRRQRALMAQQAAEQEEKRESLPTQEAPPAGWGASAQFPGDREFGPGEG